MCEDRCVNYSMRTQKDQHVEGPGKQVSHKHPDHTSLWDGSGCSFACIKQNVKVMCWSPWVEIEDFVAALPSRHFLNCSSNMVTRVCLKVGDGTPK